MYYCQIIDTFSQFVNIAHSYKLKNVNAFNLYHQSSFDIFESENVENKINLYEKLKIYF